MVVSSPNSRTAPASAPGPSGGQLPLPFDRRKGPAPLRTRLVSALRDALPLGILALAVVGVPVLVLEPHGLPRLRSLERDLEQVENENRAVEREIVRLRGQVHLLKDDLETVEHVARTELGLVRKSEIVLQLPKLAPTPSDQ